MPSDMRSPTAAAQRELHDSSNQPLAEALVSTPKYEPSLSVSDESLEETRQRIARLPQLDIRVMSRTELIQTIRSARLEFTTAISAGIWSFMTSRHSSD